MSTTAVANVARDFGQASCDVCTAGTMIDPVQRHERNNFDVRRQYAEISSRQKRPEREINVHRPRFWLLALPLCYR